MNTMWQWFSPASGTLNTKLSSLLSILIFLTHPRKMKLRTFIASNTAGIVALAYALIFLTAFVLSQLLPDNSSLSTLVLLLTFPWSMLLLFVAAWSLIHGNYPIEFYFLPCALINVISLYLLCRLSRGRKSPTLDVPGS